MLRDQPLAIPAEDVVHFRGIAFNMLVAASTIGLGRDSIGLAMAQGQQASRWVNNGARPSGVLQSDKTLSPDAAKRLKAQWEEYQAGVQNTGRTAVLEEGLKWQAVQLTAVDLQFINQQQQSVQDIARFFGVPTRKLMAPDASRGSTIIQEDQSYVNETIAPDLVQIEQKLARVFDLDEDGLGVDMDESPLLRADPQTRYNIGRIGVLSGLISTNEWRRGERLPPDPNGNEIRAPLNLAALGSDATGTAPDGAGRPEAKTVPDEGVPNESTAQDG
jgi:HK97 family phage portal protein